MSAGTYEGALREIIHAFKYDGRRSLADPLGGVLRNAGSALLEGCDDVVPVPLHPWRRMRRGFNQARDLAKRLDRRPVVDALWRVRETLPQMTLNADARHSNVRGAFSQFGGTIMYDTADSRRSTVSVVIQTKSINTNVDSRDKDLKSANFFDAEKYPLITFRSERIDRTKAGFVARGPLTMHGVTKQVAIAFKQTHGLMGDGWGNKRMGFVGHLSLNRKDYGILGTKFWNSEFDPGRMSISDNVDIDLNVEAEVNQVDKWTGPKGDSVLKVAAAQGLSKTLAEFKTAATDSTNPISKIRGGVLNTVGIKLMHRGDFNGGLEQRNAQGWRRLRPE